MTDLQMKQVSKILGKIMDFEEELGNIAAEIEEYLELGPIDKNSPAFEELGKESDTLTSAVHALCSVRDCLEDIVG